MTTDLDLESPQEMERTIRELTTRVAELRGLCHQAQSSLVDLMRDNGVLIAKVSNLTAENTRLKIDYERLQEECETLRDERDEARIHALGDDA